MSSSGKARTAHEQSDPSSRYAPRRQPSNASTHSAAGSARSAQPRSTTPSHASHTETTTTRLLVETKTLLEGLTQWSRREKSEEHISDCFVRLGNHFVRGQMQIDLRTQNQACAAFAKEGISMKDLMHVPDALRATLEDCLAEDASTAALTVHLPGIRKVIIELLSGLRAKQNQLRDLEARRETERKLAGSPPDQSEPRRAPVPAKAPPSIDARVAEANGVPKPSRTPSPDQSRRGPPPSSSRPPRRQLSGEEGWSSDTSASRPGSLASVSAPGSPPPVVRARQESVKASKSGSSLSTVREAPAPTSQPPAGSKPTDALPTLPSLGPLPNFSVDAPTPDTRTPLRTEDDATQQSLEDLKRSDALQRRASKRFSQYTYNKMTASPSPSLLNVGATSTSLLSSAAVPAIPTNSSLLASPSISEPADATAARELAARSSGRAPGVPPSPRTAKNRLSTAVEEDEDESTTTMSAPTSTPAVLAPSAPITSSVTSATATPEQRSSVIIHSDERTVYLQLNREVKKAKIEGEPTIASLRLLFIDRFAYNPGSLDFPAIYIRDGNVQYELEDMSEVVEGTVLTLNIEPLDEVKQLFETGLGSLSKELKELRVLVNARQSFQPPVVPQTPSSPPMSRPSDRQFAAAAQRVAKISASSTDAPVSPGVPVHTRSRTSEVIAAAAIPAPASPSASSMNSLTAITDAHTQRIMSDLKTHFDEVQNVRRDVGVLRQLQADFGTETKEMISRLREQAERMRTVANEKINVERESINKGKVKLDSKSQDLLTRIEELQDTTEDMRRDLIERRMRPRHVALNQLKSNVATTKKELDELADFVQMVEPQWRKTWTAELQAIVEEQELLRHHRDQLTDLQADHEAMSKMLANIDQYASLNSSAPARPGPGATNGSGNPADGLGPGRLRPFVPRSISPNQDLSPGSEKPFLAQVQGIEPDGERRLRAIEQAEKQRQKEKSSGLVTGDDLLSEVKEGKRLKKTGGVEEVDRLVEVKRLRSQKSAAALRAQIDNSTSSSTAPSLPS